MGLLPFRCLFRELAPLECSHRQQSASSLGVREFGYPDPHAGVVERLHASVDLAVVELLDELRSRLDPRSQSSHGTVAWVVRLTSRRTPCVGGERSPSGGLHTPDAEPLCLTTGVLDGQNNGNLPFPYLRKYLETIPTHG
jgi:hypothetical protein